MLKIKDHLKKAITALAILGVALLAGSQLGSTTPTPTPPGPSATPAATSTPTPGPLPRGVAGDLIADVIIGQPDFSEIVPGPTTDDKLALPHGVVVDLSTAANRFYVYDAGHNRILGFDGTCIDTPPCSASIVLGQPNMTTATCNGDSNFQNYPQRSPASDATLCGELEWGISVSEGGSGASMYVDGSGNLYVTDYLNHRILKYNSPFTTDAIADDVWGQVNFIKNDCNKTQATYWSPIPAPDATSLCFNWGSSNNWTAGVDVDASGNVWVADSGNNRVLMYPPGSKTAIRVLGQPNFTSRTAGNGLNQMRDPAVVRVSSQGWVYVAQHKTTDPNLGRMMIFKPPFSNGMSASVVKTFNRPSSIDFDPTQPGVWIMNELNRTLELWDEDLAGASPIETIGFSGQGNLLDDASGSLGIDSDGNLMMAIGRGSYTDDVLLFRKEAGGYASEVRLFNAHQPYRTDRDLDAAVNGVQWAKNPDVDPLLDSQLVVGGGGRILFWNNPDPNTMSNYQPADGFLDWESCNFVPVCNPVISGFDDADGACCAGMSVSDNHLWVSMFAVRDDPHRILVYELPLASGELPVQEITAPFAVLPDTVGGPQGSLGGGGKMWGLVAQADSSNLWISQTGSITPPVGNRTFRLRDPLGVSPIVDVILGQTSTTGTSCNRGGSPTSSTLCVPGSLALDRQENLFVSDHSLEIQGNRRLLEFDAALFPPASPTVLYAPPASRIFPNIATWQPAFDSGNRMVVGYNPYACPDPSCPDTSQNRYFPGVYNQPLSGSTDADSHIQDFHSMAFSASFDDADNLYIADLNRGRVLAYITPMQAIAPTPTPTAPPPPTPTPTSAATPTPTPPITVSSVILRPDSQGVYSDWRFAVPDQAHYLNVDEVIADDDGSHYNDQVWNSKDTQSFPGAGLPANVTIDRVAFKFRWKHFDNITLNPAGPNMWSLFRESGVDTRGPTFQSTNAAGWRTDEWVMTVNPRTGQPWTLAELNGGLEFGFEIYPTAGAWNYITQTWVEVWYKVAVLRPSGQGNYAEWANAVPSQAHYLNVDEVVADDDTSQFNDQSWNLKDTHVYPNPGLPGGAVIDQVTFKFRWKHFDNITPNPAGPNMWSLFRESGVDTRGPTFQSTNAAGWHFDEWAMTLNPRTGLPWTVAEVNAGLELGFEIYPTAGAWNYITQAWIEVTHH